LLYNLFIYSEEIILIRSKNKDLFIIYYFIILFINYKIYKYFIIKKRIYGQSIYICILEYLFAYMYLYICILYYFVYVLCYVYISICYEK